MNNIILEELKSNLKQIEEKEKNKIDREERLKELNTKKIYLKLWKYILSNMSKKEFKIYIWIYENLITEEEYITMIKVDKLIKKITRTKLNASSLINLLIQDDIPYKSSAAGTYGKRTIKLEITITRNILKNIIESTEKSNQKTLK